jgi:hypothetical protein
MVANGSTQQPITMQCAALTNELILLQIISSGKSREYKYCKEQYTFFYMSVKKLVEE